MNAEYNKVMNSLVKSVKPFKFYSKNSYERLILQAFFKYNQEYDGEAFTPDIIKVKLRKVEKYGDKTSLIFRVKIVDDKFAVDGKQNFTVEIFNTVMYHDYMRRHFKSENLEYWAVEDLMEYFDDYKCNHIDNSTDCPICLEPFEEDKKKCGAYCGHSLCMNCFEGLRTTVDDYMRCPICRKYFFDLEEVLTSMLESCQFDEILDLMSDESRNELFDNIDIETEIDCRYVNPFGDDFVVIH
jgi:hypothetical protein